jgi:hypothetical protein
LRHGLRIRDFIHFRGGFALNVWQYVRVGPAKFEGRARPYFTPTSASWLDQIEIETFFQRHNERARPFR